MFSGAFLRWKPQPDHGSLLLPMIRKACGGGPCLTSSSVRGEVDQISLPSCVWRRGRRFPLRGPRAELGEPPRRPPPRMGAEHWLRPLQTRARRLLTRVSPGLHHQSRTVHYTRWKFRQSPFPLLRPVNCSGTTNKSGVVYPFPSPSQTTVWDSMNFTGNA